MCSCQRHLQKHVRGCLLYGNYRYRTSSASTSLPEMRKQQCSISGRPTFTVNGITVKINTAAKRLLLIFRVEISPCRPLTRDISNDRQRHDRSKSTSSHRHLLSKRKANHARVFHNHVRASCPAEDGRV